MSDAPDPSQKAAIEQLRQRTARVRAAERDALVGQLAGAVSHDLNNALGVVVTYASLLMSTTPEGSEAWDDLDSIFKAGKRAGELTRWLNLFSRDPDAGSDHRASLTECARGMQKVAESVLAGSGLGSEFLLEASGEPVAMPRRHVEDTLFALLAEAASCLEDGSIVVEVATESGERVSVARLLGRGDVAAIPPVGDLSLLAPGPFDTGSPEALLPLNQRAERYGGRVRRIEHDKGFDLVLELPLQSNESDVEEKG